MFGKKKKCDICDTWGAVLLIILGALLILKQVYLPEVAWAVFWGVIAILVGLIHVLKK